MISPDTLNAFVLAAELGSFSAAARRLGKAQSAVSTAIANLEIDCGVDLFDRSGRSPVLTEEGEALLPHARGILLGQREFMAKASSMAEGIETGLCLAIELGIGIRPLAGILERFGREFTGVTLEILMPSPSETQALLKSGRADIGLMTEQEGYPLGFQFRGVGHSRLIPVCAPGHPLAASGAAEAGQVDYRDLRQHRQIIRHAAPVQGSQQQSEKKSASVWHAEDPALIVELVCAGFGWAELPMPVVAGHLERGDLVKLGYRFQQSDILEGIDVVWTEHRALGIAGQWMRDRILALPQDTWLDG